MFSIGRSVDISMNLFLYPIILKTLITLKCYRLSKANLMNEDIFYQVFFTSVGLFYSTLKAL